MEMRKPSTSNVRSACRVKKTSRAKLIQRIEEQQDCDIVEQHSSVQVPGAHAQPKRKRTVKTKEAKNFSKSEAEMVDVMDTLQRVISIIEKEIAKNLCILAEGNRHTEHEQRHGSVDHKRKTSMSIAFSKQCQ